MVDPQPNPKSWAEWDELHDKMIKKYLKNIPMPKTTILEDLDWIISHISQDDELYSIVSEIIDKHQDEDSLKRNHEKK